MLIAYFSVPLVMLITIPEPSLEVSPLPLHIYVLLHRLILELLTFYSITQKFWCHFPGDAALSQGTLCPDEPAA